MPPSNIIIGQKVDPQKVALAKEFRKDMTEAEKILWRHLRTNRLEGWHFRRQQVIAGFIVDFYCHDAGLVIEVDGPIHETQADYDEERDKALADYGVSVLRVRNEEVFQNIKGVLETILFAVKEKCKMKEERNENLPPNPSSTAF